MKDNFITIPYKVLRNKKLTITDKLIIGFVIGFTKGKCSASNQYLAELLSVTERTIKNSTRKMEKLGVLKKENKYSGGRCLGKVMTIDLKNVHSLSGEKFSVSGEKSSPLVVKKRGPNNIVYNNINTSKGIYMEKIEKNEPSKEQNELEKLNPFQLSKKGYRRDDNGKIIPRNDMGE